MFNYTYVYIRI